MIDRLKPLIDEARDFAVPVAAIGGVIAAGAAFNTPTVMKNTALKECAPDPAHETVAPVSTLDVEAIGKLACTQDGSTFRIVQKD